MSALSADADAVTRIVNMVRKEHRLSVFQPAAVDQSSEAVVFAAVDRCSVFTDDT